MAFERFFPVIIDNILSGFLFAFVCTLQISLLPLHRLMAPLLSFIYHFCLVLYFGDRQVLLWNAGNILEWKAKYGQIHRCSPLGKAHARLCLCLSAPFPRMKRKADAHSKCLKFVYRQRTDCFLFDLLILKSVFSTVAAQTTTWQPTLVVRRFGLFV